MKRKHFIIVGLIFAFIMTGVSLARPKDKTVDVRPRINTTTTSTEHPSERSDSVFNVNRR